MASPLHGGEPSLIMPGSRVRVPPLLLADEAVRSATRRPAPPRSGARRGPARNPVTPAASIVTRLA